MNTLHKHAELIKKWADGASIQIKSRVEVPNYCKSGDWIDVGTADRSPTWWPDREYRVKPEVTTSLSNNELWDIYYKGLGYHAHSDMSSNNGLRIVADAAIKQYIKEQTK